MSRIVYGLNPVVELLKAGRDRIDEILIAQGGKPGRVAELQTLARSAGVTVRSRPREELNDLARGAVHQGVIARVGEFRYLSLDDLLDRTDIDLAVMLDGIQDPMNLGAIARTALAAGAGALIIPKDRAAKVTPAAMKASAGTLSRLPVARVTNLNRTAEALKKAGYWLLGTSGRAEESLYQTDPPLDKLVVVIGAEGKGVGPTLAKKCDFLVKLPLAGGVESLNASAAAAAVLFELSRRRSAEG